MAETRRLVFKVSPLSAKGSLAQQVRDGLRAVEPGAGGSIVKLRAFVAHGADAGRVREMILESYKARRRPLPVLTVVQVGGLPAAGAQVVFESTSVARQEVNPHGLAFISGQYALSKGPSDPVAPLTAEASRRMRNAVAAIGSTPKDVLRVTCFLSSLQDLATARVHFDREYPGAARNYIQTQRIPEGGIAECEAVARLTSAAAEPLELRHAGEWKPSPSYREIAMVSAREVVLTGMQTASGKEEADFRQAFQRLEETLQQEGTSLMHAAFTSYYPLSGDLANLVRKVRPEFIDLQRPPAATMLPFEGLPVADAGFAGDVIAVRPSSRSR